MYTSPGEFAAPLNAGKVEEQGEQKIQQAAAWMELQSLGLGVGFNRSRVDPSCAYTVSCD